MAKTKYTEGSVWGNKQIVAPAGRNNYGQVVYHWKCVRCGRIYGPSTGTDISRSPYTKCCPRKLDEKLNYKGYKEITGSKMTQIKDSARRRGFTYTVDGPYLWSVWEAQQGKCAYTGKQLTHGVDASLDRIDSRVGYEPGNVQWVDWTVNRMKLNIPHEEFIQICSLIASRNGDRNDRNKEPLDT